MAYSNTDIRNMGMYGKGPAAQSVRDSWLSDRAWDRGREAHERGLQMQEQQRRLFDSETARQLGEKKYGVLSGLLGGAMGSTPSPRTEMPGFTTDVRGSRRGRRVTLGGHK
jgi:hypothetical protein